MKPAVTTVERRGRDVRYLTEVEIGGEVLAVQTIVGDREQAWNSMPVHHILRKHEDQIMHNLRCALFSPGQ